MITTGYPDGLLDALSNMSIRESYVKIELLDWNENFIQEIQGVVTTGSFSFDGKSSMRRTCNFTMVIPDGQDEYELARIINLNKKFRLYIGYKNNLMDYQDYPDILWFKMGLYVFITANFNHSIQGSTINVTARDKMCLLNGQVQGVIPESIILHNKETYIYSESTSTEVPLSFTIESDEKGKYVMVDGERKDVQRKLIPILVKDIIYELVSHYGRENKGKIIINDIPKYGRLLVKYIGTAGMALTKTEKGYNIDFLEDPTENPPTGAIMVKQYGDLLGYKITKLIFPGELITNVGDTVTAILDKICNVFGNFEYFYDVDGNFIFQEKKNYLNNSYVPLESDEITGKLIANFNKSKIDYSFKDNKIVSSFTNNPKWDNIKNDFVVWGKRTDALGKEYPIHFHLAIDNRPEEKDNLDYRQVILNNDQQVGESAASDYYKELSAFWAQNYNADKKEFTSRVTQDPMSLNYWLEIYPAQGKYAKYSVPSIGRRTYAISDSDATCIYPPDVPGIVWYADSDDTEFNKFDSCDNISQSYFNGYPVVRMTPELSSAVVAAEDRKSCFEVIRELLYKHLSLQETITIQCLPVYWLEPGDLIDVHDAKSNIKGEYIITNISLPLQYNGLMSITAMRAEQRI